MGIRPDDGTQKRDRPPGPRINLPLAVIGQMLPKLFPFDPLAFGVDNARQFGDHGERPGDLSRG